jgi:SAM-dependent methyltransferase
MLDRSRARELCNEYAQSSDRLAWFDALYREAERGESEIPWDDRAPNLHLVAFWNQSPQQAKGKNALVVGCGLGEDAQQIAAWGYRTTAFDLSPTAIKAARSRFPKSNVDYIAQDLFRAPAQWRQAFDFVFEANTLQALPADLRPAAIGAVANFVSPAGLLLVIARAREESEPTGDLPWPLTKREFSVFRGSGLIEKSLAEIIDAAPPHTRRFQATYTRP